MTFSYDGTDLSTIIKKYEQNGSNYSIEYLDGSMNNYVCYNTEEEDNIKKLMIEQLKERQDNINLDELYKLKNIEFLASIIGALGSSVFYNNKEYFLALLTFIFLTVNLKGYRNKNKKVKELKKAKLFLEMIGDLEKVNQSQILKIIEFDNIYQKELNINTLDEFNYYDVKRIYNKLKVKK